MERKLDSRPCSRLGLVYSVFLVIVFSGRAVSWAWLAKTVFICVLIVVPLFGGATWAAGQEDGADTPPEIVFIPPEIGVPKDRMGAGTRDVSLNTDSGLLLLLVPEGGGLTTLAAPPLIWRLTSGHRGYATVQVAPVGQAAPELRIEGPFPPGDYGLDLGRSGFELDTNLIYLWQVALIDPNSGKAVARSSGLIERVPDALKSGAAATAGLWFDALAEVTQIGLSGRAQAKNPAGVDQLLTSAGVGQ